MAEVRRIMSALLALQDSQEVIRIRVLRILFQRLPVQSLGVRQAPGLMKLEGFLKHVRVDHAPPALRSG